MTGYTETLNAPLSTGTRFLTGLYFVMVMGGLAVAFLLGPLWLFWVLLAVLVATTVGVVLYRPLRYGLSPEGVVVERPIGDLVIPRDRIRTVRVLTGSDKHALRAFGVGGVFGYYGRFWSKTEKWLDFYVTDLGVPFVLIETDDGRKRVLSPTEAGRERLLGWIEASGR